ncbi:TonB-dependent receptor domain-containing protein [Ferruginivarius sediminum]|uniref:TonB-dependent receptor n=1 Tax=Ferruginivarius sediminum TaxID=2661937 RepID=A0A369T5W6_9PROT|nr:TonB-dependent receptor [Ferruginivarius sediminum]RDD60658.1 TonB-dependent receptor [Ferruginivarius sediminum]
MTGAGVVGIALLVFALCLADTAAIAEERCRDPVGRLVSAQGIIELKSRADEDWEELKVDASLCPGDTLHVRGRSRAAVFLFASRAILRVDQNTTLKLGPAREGQSFLDLFEGGAHFFSRRPRALNVSTPFVNAGVEGTEFYIRVGPSKTDLTVFQGQVEARNEKGRLAISSGASATAGAGMAPEERAVTRPRDLIGWTLYYPPVFALGDGEDLAPNVEAAREARARGDLAAAFEAMERIPEAERDSDYHVHLAALLADVGRAGEARTAIDTARHLAPRSGKPDAIDSVIVLARGQRQRALDLARRAVRRSPDVPATHLALSYALQADLQLDAALDSTLTAAERFPEHSLLWARTAELWLAKGDTATALAAAETGASLRPRLAPALSILGFARLSRFQTDKAIRAFRDAIALNSASPTPRLGLGLAKIRQGQLAEGRQEIEIAAALDPGDALLRSYLGKAYFEERRDKPAADELRTAKTLDPDSPTPYFYDALRKQAENRPTEALSDLRKSTARNDNRAVYRSRLLLDEDLAVRGTSAARIYDDLGFERLARLQASRSLALDPTNHSAHRFLADSFRGSARQESARVSELLRAQLLQPLNIQPVQASLSETEVNLPSRAAPNSPAFNEFTPLFVRDDVQLAASGLGGDDGTFGDEVVVSGIAGRGSFSLSQFHFETDGFRPNNDLRHDIIGGFGQVSLTPEFSVQFEARHRDTEQGDLELRFDPDDFGPEDRREQDEDTFRLGSHLKLSPRADVITSVIYEDRDAKQFNSQRSLAFLGGVPIPVSVDITEDVEAEGVDAQTQLLLRGDGYSAIVGGGVGTTDLREETSTLVQPFGISESSTRDVTERQHSLYGYVHGNLPDPVIWTLGFSYDSYEKAAIDVDKLSPKLGVQWEVTPTIRLRAAVMRTVRRPLLADQTLEPSQVAGFFQFFDDPNGTAAWRSGVGVDVTLGDSLFAGLEASWRELDVPLEDESADRSETFDQDEARYGGYLYWIPAERWAISLTPSFEQIDVEESIGPERLETLEAPLGVRYFHPSGLFAGISGSLVHQTFDPRINGAGTETETFGVLDAFAGLRLPGRQGIISLEGRNLTDADFNFQDDNFVNFGRPVRPRYEPDRQVIARLTLIF